jgi:DNA sulfur modification protein DndD
MEEVDRITEKLKLNNESINNLHAEIATADKLAKEYSQKLHDNQKTKEYQQRREELKSKASQLNLELSENTSEVEKLVSEKAYVLFTQDLVDSGKTILAKLREEGKVPAGISKDYVEKLLTEAQCICVLLLK